MILNSTVDVAVVSGVIAARNCVGNNTEFGAAGVSSEVCGGSKYISSGKCAGAPERDESHIACASFKSKLMHPASSNSPCD